MKRHKWVRPKEKKVKGVKNKKYLDKPIKYVIIDELQSKATDFDTSNGLSFIFGEGLTIEVIGNIYQNKEIWDSEVD